MKKLYMLVLSTMFVLILNGCGGDVKSKTCSKEYDDYIETYVFTAKDDKIEKAELTIEYKNSLFGIETLNSLTEEQKKQVRENMIATLGLEDKEYEGLELVIDIKDTMTVNIKADYDKADVNVLNKVGLDFTSTNMNIDAATEAYMENGGNCK